VKEHRGADEQRGESEHHPGGDMVVHGPVDVERNAADEREVDADRGEEQLGGHAGAAPAHERPQPAQVAAHTVGEDHDEHARDLQRAVEQLAGEVVEGAQPAEVQVPPQRIGGREDGGEDPSTQDGEHGEGQLHGARTGDERARRKKLGASRKGEDEPACDGLDGDHSGLSTQD
jgi:hypothetical protein